MDFFIYTLPNLTLIKVMSLTLLWSVYGAQWLLILMENEDFVFMNEKMCFAAN